MDKRRIGAFAERVFGDLGAFMTVGLAYLGTKTGLFNAMAGKGPLSLADVVALSALQPRYVEEWLKGMVAAGYLEYDPQAETFTLPEEHAYLLASEGTDHFMGGMFYQAQTYVSVGPQVAEAFRGGGGVAFQEYGPQLPVALDLGTRGIYEQRFVSYWLQAVPDVVAKLEAGATALDVGCGVGRVSMALARSFPNSRFVGLDVDGKSIALARKAAEAEGLGARVEFVHGALQDLAAARPFDLITCCDCVHDLAEPLPTLREIRRRLAADGTLFVVEIKVADRLEDNRNAIATMFYGFSTFHCMTQSLAQGGPGLGACMGPTRTEALMRDAGFGRFRALEIKSPTNLFYAVGH